MNKKRVLGEILVVWAIAIFVFNLEITGAVTGSAGSLNLWNFVALTMFIAGLFIMKAGLESVVIGSKVKQDPLLLKVAEKVGKNDRVSKEINHLIEELNKGNTNPGVGTKTIPDVSGIYELRGNGGGRVYFRKVDKNKYEILGYSDKDTKNQDKVINRLRKLYN